MKFGKDLEQYKSAGWQDDYIDYKGLKVILKKLEEEGADREEVDAEFFQSLEDELAALPPVEEVHEGDAGRGCTTIGIISDG